MVSVTMTSVSGLSAMRSSAEPENTVRGAAVDLLRARVLERGDGLDQRSAVSISSSMMTAVLPPTSPMMFITSVRSAAFRRR